MAAVLQLLGLVAIVAGIVMVYVPAGIIAGGFVAVVVGYLLERERLAKQAGKTAEGDG